MVEAGAATSAEEERVRRRAVASLGELLFYIATQSEQSPRPANAPLVREVPDVTFAAVGSLLRRGEDEVAQHYAVKTIENVASQGGTWAAKFAGGEIIAFELGVHLPEQQTGASACDCRLLPRPPVRLARVQPLIVPSLLERLGARTFVHGLGEGSSKTQQTYLNLLNMGLQGVVKIGPTRLQAQLLSEERALIPTLMACWSTPQKCRGRRRRWRVGCCQAGTRWLTALCNVKVMSIPERLARDTNEYVQQ
ncbi:Serine-threonine protein kinase FUSED [Klebsormidium nitens]|uniref:Serine-threonine protein kinase FUSED n=1 Tax=Klebsormidium nitens TaxID=105231 RepID=A0A1Y1IQY8_KLENI|nr:Serine-threonine protein kinase FUSED [Klebsormidium nitens]|eukprot:GAQ91889.1 Serine-threonine protein kinase FUSED [Klebsormidium nitens]